MTLSEFEKLQNQLTLRLYHELLFAELVVRINQIKKLTVEAAGIQQKIIEINWGS